MKKDKENEKRQGKREKTRKMKKDEENAKSNRPTSTPR